jgi:hypothetical protein
MLKVRIYTKFIRKEPYESFTKSDKSCEMAVLEQEICGGNAVR